MNKSSLTIGIPAFNEEANINGLIMSIFEQEASTYYLEKIIVVVDACTDNTIEEILKIKNRKIQLIINKQRRGKAYGLNLIAKEANTDILVHLDADILLKDKRTIENIIEPISVRGADLTSARVKEYWATSKFEEVLKISMVLKKEIFEHYNHGNNMYTCHGRARGLSKKLYKNMIFSPEIIAEDAFSYLYAVANGYKYLFAKKSNVHYRLPRTLADHKRQSVRFFNSYKQLKNIFGAKLMNTEGKLPKSIVVKYTFKYVLRYPITLFLYACILVKMKFNARIERMTTSTWSVSKSSKSFKSII